MPELQKFALAEVEPGRVALCRIYGDAIEAKDWQAARAQVKEGTLDHCTGYGFVPPAEKQGA